MWIRRHPVRAAIYAALAVAIALAAARAGSVAAWLVNGPAGHAIARRLGVTFHIGELRAGIASSDVIRLSAEVETEPRVRFSADRIRIEGLRLIKAGKVAFGETVTAGDATIDIPARSAVVKNLEFARKIQVAEVGAAAAPIRFEAHTIAGFGAQVKSASAGPVELGRAQVRVGNAQVDGIHVAAVRDASGRWNLEDAAALAGDARQIEREVSALGNFYSKFIGRFRDLLFWTIVIAAIATAAAKFLFTYGSAALRAASAVLVLLAPFLAHRFGLYISLGAIAAAALLLFLAIYRKAPEWHQRAEPLVIDLVGPSLLALLLFAYLLVFPALPVIPRTVRIEQARVNGVSAGIDDGRNRFSIVSPAIAAEKIVVAESTQIPLVSAPNTTISGTGWRVTLTEVEASGVNASAKASSVKQVTFRGGAESDFVRERLARYDYLPDNLKRRTQVAFAGDASVSGPPVQFKAQSSVRAEGVNLSVRAEGDTGSVRVTSIRSSEPSALRIADGNAHIALAPAGASTVHLAGLAVRQVAVGAVDITLKQGRAETRIRVLDLPNARIDELFANAGFKQNRLTVDASTRNFTFRSADGVFSGDVPNTNTQLTGKWRPDALDGEIRLTSSRFGLGCPLRFSADLRAGTLEVPSQSCAITQSVVPRAPDTINARLDLTARLLKAGPAANIHLLIPSLPLDVQPLGLELTDIDANAALSSGKTELKIETGWNRVRYPSVPRPNRLESVDRLRLNLDLKGEFFNPELLEGWRAPALEPLPEKFRVSGAWPGLRIITGKEESRALEGLTVALKRLAMPRSRIQSVDIDFGLRKVGDFHLNLESHVSLSDELARVKVGGAFAWAPSFEVTAHPGQFEGSAPIVRPDFGGFQGNLRGLRATGKYSGDLISSISGAFTLDGGPLFDLKIGNAPITAAGARLNSPANVVFSLDQAGASADVSAPAFVLTAEAKEAGSLSASGGIDTAVRLINDPKPAPILDSLERTARLARPHYTRAREFMGAPAPREWRIAARNSAPNPFLRMGSDRLELRGVFEAGSFKTKDVAADVVERNRNLLIDASVPVEIEGRDEPLVVPVQLALTEPFPEPGRAAGMLWDSAALEKIWDDAKPRHASDGVLLDRRLVAFGPASLLQVMAPLGPVRTVVGLGDRIQIHAPFESRLAFGLVPATAQVELSWHGNSPAVTARLEGTFRNVQAGAIGLGLSGFHHPFIEDSFDGSFGFSANDVAVTRESATGWLADPASFDQFHRVGLSFHMERSKKQAGPGVAQLAFDTRVRLMNEVLQMIADQLKFLVPPQMVTYRGLRVDLDAANGIIQTKNPLLELSGVKILSTELLDVNGDVRVRLGDRLASEMPVSHLVRSALGGAR